MILEHPVGTKRYVPIPKFGVYELTYNEKGLWVSSDGTIWALRRDSGSKDDVDRCGIEPFALPLDSPLTPLCRVHDYMYESPAYQMFHTRKQADKELMRLIGASDVGSFWKLFKRPFYWLSRQFGRNAWENESTNN